MNAILKALLAFICACCVTVSSFAQPRAWPMDFSILSSPEANGTSTEGSISYRYSDHWAVSLRARLLKNSETSVLDSMEKSLNLSDSSQTEVFFVPIDYEMKKTNAIENASLGAGFYYSSQALREVGFFELTAPTGINSYSNNLATTMYGPLLESSIAIPLSGCELTASLCAIPVFFYATFQDTAIEPLMATEGEHSGSGIGAPNIMADIAMRFSEKVPILRYFALDGRYEFQCFNFDQLAVDTTDNGSTWSWETRSNQYNVHKLSVRASVSIPLTEKGCLELGAGYRFSWTVPENSTALYSGKVIYKIAFLFKN